MSFCGQSTCRISCSLTTHDIDRTPEYYALSYCWGDSKDLTAIECNGQGLSVSPGLLNALISLQSLRSNLNMEYFWIDQICINQNDKDEQTDQVNLMRTIYAQSQRTLIWLGPYDIKADGDTFGLVDLIDRARREDACPKPLPTNPRSVCEYITPQRNGKLGLPELSSRRWAALATFMRRPWFTRAWVIQEAALSRTSPLMICGEAACLWDKFFDAIAWLDELRYQDHTAFRSNGIVPLFIHRLRQCRDTETGLPRYWNLEAILISISGLQATDARDHIYAYLGLTIDAQNRERRDPVLTPNYRKDKYKVFEDIARYCIRKSGRLNILGVGEAGNGWCNDSCFSPPSWVPRWDVEIRSGPHKKIPGPIDLTDDKEDVKVITTVHALGHRASLDSSAQILETNNTNELVLRGIHVDTVIWCSDILNDKDFITRTEDIRLNLLENPTTALWEAVVEQLNIKLDTTDQRFHDAAKAFYLALVTGESPERTSAKNEPMGTFWCYLGTCYLFKYRYVQHIDLHHMPTPPILYTCALLAPDGVQDRVVTHLDGLKLFATQNGYIGCGTGMLGVQDEVYVMYGGATPHVLRQDGKNGYQFLGEAYIHGYMEGEALDKVKEGVFHDEWVTLR
ncbi:HET-domain-containing protein [Setomelanomma holmii]|uniref:HET-domain-containing protein n=1 Tax=Setomelanomma holmii TaxID=210430 RepID=A0A9P4HGE6_9PLEO|nr:HET-domain-containing protein [Setomelanomma holmii]